MGPWTQYPSSECLYTELDIINASCVLNVKVFNSFYLPFPQFLEELLLPEGHYADTRIQTVSKMDTGTALGEAAVW